MKNINKILSTSLIIILCLLLFSCGSNNAQNSDNKPDVLLRRIECLNDDNLDSFAMLSDNKMAVFAHDFASESPNTAISIVDIEKDEIKQNKQFDNFFSIFPSNGFNEKIVLKDISSNKAQILNSDLNSENLTTFNALNGFFSEEEDAFYFAEGGLLVKKDINSGNEQSIFTGDFDPDDVLFVDSERVVLSGCFNGFDREKKCAVLDLKEGTLSTFAIDDKSVSINDDNVFYSYYNENWDRIHAMISLKDDCELLINDCNLDGDYLKIPGTNYSFFVKDSKLFLLKFEETLSSALISDNFNYRMIFDAKPYGESKIVFNVYGDYENHYYVLDTRLAEFNESDIVFAKTERHLDSIDVDFQKPVPEYEELGDYLENQENYAHYIEDLYGVTILLSNQCADKKAVFYDKTITTTDENFDPYTEQNMIENGLAVLESTLEQFPEGFFKQFRNREDCGGVRFLLVDSITDSNLTAGGVCKCTEKWFDVAVDINTAATNETYCHELWHAIEEKIKYINPGAFLYDDWNSLNPEGYVYCGNYGDYYNEFDYTFAYVEDDWYFVDSYSHVNEKEDRARIFETACETNGVYRANVYASEKVKNKLVYMNSMIYSAFETSNWPKTPFWMYVLY